MEKVIVPVECPKELLEIVQCLVGIVDDIKQKKEIGVIVAENLQALIKAIDGSDKLTVEIKEKEALNVALIAALELVKVLKA